MTEDELRSFIAEVRTLRASNTALHARQSAEANGGQRTDSKLASTMKGYLDD